MCHLLRLHIQRLLGDSFRFVRVSLGAEFTERPTDPQLHLPLRHGPYVVPRLQRTGLFQQLQNEAFRHIRRDSDDCRRAAERPQQHPLQKQDRLLLRIHPAVGVHFLYLWIHDLHDYLQVGDGLGVQLGQQGAQPDIRDYEYVLEVGSTGGPDSAVGRQDRARSHSAFPHADGSYLCASHVACQASIRVIPPQEGERAHSGSAPRLGHRSEVPTIRR